MIAFITLIIETILWSCDKIWTRNDAMDKAIALIMLSTIEFFIECVIISKIFN